MTLLWLSLLACDKDTPEPNDTALPGETAVEDLGCGTARGELPSGLSTLAWDDETIDTNTLDYGYTLTGYGGSWFTPDEVQNEAVRFGVEAPATIYGFSVMWTNLPEGGDPDMELSAGVYPDFGYNGFDFWPEPLWEGTRCLGDIVEGEWVDYVLDAPITLDHEALMYVAHQKQDADSPVWPWDSTIAGDGTCGTFDECHSAWNFPTLDTDVLYNGWSFPLPFDYLVRLHVAYADVDYQPVFEDVTGELSVSTRHSWGDFDNDGWDDLFTTGTLLRNQGDGSFADVTDSSGLVDAYFSGGVWGDFDNDSCLDLFVFAEITTGYDTLWKGDCAGGFIDVTGDAGIADVQDYNLCDEDESQNHAPSPAAAWLDLNGDTWLDLYVVGFICWPEYSYYRDQVFINNGDGTFTEITGEQGFETTSWSGRGAAPADGDGDGDVDLMVNNYTLHRNLYFRNDGDGTVTEVAKTNGTGGTSISSYYGHTIGAAWGDLDNDGDLDAIQANLAHPRFFHFSDKTQVLINDGSGDFDDITGDWERPESNAGLRYQETHSVPVLADFDNDGILDLAISAVYEGRPTDFYWGNGDGTFDLDAQYSGLDVSNGWGMAVSDYDQDGDVDIAARGALFDNVGAPGNWLQVRVLGGTISNTAALGATVRVKTDSHELMRHVQGGSGQGDQDSMYLHFGLADASQVESIQVTFPGGASVEYGGPFQANQRVWLSDDGRSSTGWEWPW